MERKQATKKEKEICSQSSIAYQKEIPESRIVKGIEEKIREKKCCGKKRRQDKNNERRIQKERNVFTKMGKISVEGIQRKKRDGSKVDVKMYPSNTLIVELDLNDKNREKIIKRERPSVTVPGEKK